MAVEVGSAYVSIWPKMDGSKWASAINGAIGGVNTSKAGQTIGNGLSKGVGNGLSTAKVAIGNILANVAAKGIDAIRNSLDSAISRVDTLNQFPKVMKNLGFSTDEANASISKMSSGIEGLPTTLDGIVKNTQAFALTLGDLGQATDVALAVNDGMLAFGASSEGAAEAVRQLNQMIATGKYDMQSWNSINSAAPGLLDTVAKAMLGTGANATQLREALNSGQISTQDFLNAMVQLDTEGAAGITSFAETARTATGGIATSMKNVGSAIVKNLGNIINALNGSGSISGMFDTIKGAINGMGSALVPVAEKVGQFFSWITSGSPGATAALQAVGTAIAGIGTALTVANFGKITTGIAGLVTNSKLLTGAMTGVKAVMTAFSGPVGIVIGVITALVAAFMVLWNTNETFRTSMQALGAEIMSALQPALSTIGTMLTNLASAVMPMLTAMIAQLAPVITQIITTLMQLASAVLPVIISFIQMLLPVLTQIITVVMQLVTAILPILAQLLTTIVPIIAQIITVVVQVATQIMAVVMPIIQQIVALIQQAMPIIQTVITTVMNVIMSVIQTVWPAIQQIMETVMNAIMAVVNAVWPVIQTIIETAMNVIQAVISTVMALIQGDWEGVWNGIQQIAQAIWDGIKNLIDAAINAIKGVIEAVLNAIKGIWDSIWNAISSLAQSIWSAIQSFISSAIQTVQSVISGALNAIQSLWNSIWSAVSSFVSDTWNNVCNAVSNGVSNVIGFISGLPGQIMGFFADAGSWLINAGANIINGLLDGIKSAVGAVWDFVSGIGAKIASLKGPERYDKRLLIPAGKWIMQGLNNGLTEGFDPVRSNLRGITDEISDFKAEMAYQAKADLTAKYEGLNTQFRNQFDPESFQNVNLTKDDVAEAMAQALEGKGDIALYLDGKKVASTLAGPMDIALAVQSARR